MPGWDSLETVTRIQGAAQIAAFVLLALLLTAAILLFLQRRHPWPEWIDVGSYQVRSPVFGISAAVVLALLAVTTFVAYGYGVRQNALAAAAGQTHADELRRMADQAKARQVEARDGDETKGRGAGENPAQQQQRELTDLRRELSAAENQRTDLQRKLSETENRLAELQGKPSEAGSQLTELQRKLSETESRLAELQRKPSESGSALAELQRKLSEHESKLAALHHKEMQKRLSDDEKKLLVEALKPFAGQKIALASRVGDEDGKVLAEDFIAVFDAAGWSHGGNAGVSFRRWDRDPLGIEITLNEADARAGRISGGLGALINALRKLGLAYDNTIYMTREVPAGLALLKIGRKLPK